MPVVQRIQRLYPTLPEPVRGWAGRFQANAARPNWAQVSCAAGLLGADMLAFLVAALVMDFAIARRGDDVLAGAGLPLAAAVLSGMVGYFSSHDHYEHRVPFWTECRDVVRATFAAFVFAASAAYLLDLQLSRLAVVGTALLYPPAVLGIRSLTRTLLTRAGLWTLPVLIVGDGEWASQVEAALRRHPRLGYEVVGRTGEPAPGRCWGDLLTQHRAQLLVLAHESERRLSQDLVAGLVRERVPYAILPSMDGLPLVGRRHAYLDQDTILVSYRNNLRKPVARAAKISFDLAAASAALLVLAPAMLLVAALVGLDGGPIFYAHTRIGAHGRVFRCLKFRSMVVDSEAALQRLFQRDPAAEEEWTRTHKLRADPRVTWVGRFLRKTSLDELPQLFNVLRLEMSLVGPRPIVSLEIPKYAEDIVYYYETRPGITGLWQVSGRSDTTYAQRVRLDSWYVKNWTIWQDFSIIARTIPAVVSGRGAG